MPCGLPVSQLLVAFQGRSERLSSSVEAQPVAKNIVTVASARSKPLERTFIGRNLVYDLVSFKDVFLFPFRHDVGNGAIWLDPRDLHPGDKFSIAIDEHAGIRNETLVGADVEDDEIIFRINS